MEKNREKRQRNVKTVSVQNTQWDKIPKNTQCFTLLLKLSGTFGIMALGKFSCNRQNKL